MAKVMIVSRTFPKHHKRAGEDTNFVPKIWNSLGYPGKITMKGLEDEFYSWQHKEMNPYDKNHTVRAGSYWKEGELMSLRVWSGTPYRSKQIKIYEDLSIKKIYKLEIISTDNGILFIFDGELIDIRKLAHNDGLNVADLHSWFIDDPKYKGEFVGQVIVWNEKVLKEYGGNNV